MTQFFTSEYWFNVRAGNLAPMVQNSFIILLVLLLILAISASIIRKKKTTKFKKTWAKLQVFGQANLVIGLMFLFFTYEGVPFLSTRVLFLVWGIAMATRLTYIYRFYRKAPGKKKISAERKEYLKYIPK